MSQLTDANNSLVSAAAHDGKPDPQGGISGLIEDPTHSPAELHHHILTVLRATVRADVAYCYTITGGGSAEMQGSAWSADRNLPVPKRTLSQLSAATRVRGDAVSAVDDITHQTISSVTVAPSLVCESTNGLRLSLQTGKHWLGVAGVARSRDHDAWGQADIVNLSHVVSAICSLVELHARCAELSRYALASRLTGGSRDVLCVVNLNTQRIAWHNAEHLSAEDRRRLLASEAELYASAIDALAQDANRTAYWSCGRIAQLMDLGESSLFGMGRCVLLTLELIDNQTEAATRGLSVREREIADLLVAGYAAINAAAILHLSEHTVRTYIRRLYRKLNVSNRADLVRKLVGNTPAYGLTMVDEAL